MARLLDYSRGVIAGHAIIAAGFQGAIRYVDAPTAALNRKHIRPAEYADLVAAGVQVLLVFEIGTTDALGGHAAGVANAQRARAGADWIGYPPDGIIFFCSDNPNLAPDEVPTALAYLDGAASILGRSCVGAYGFSNFINPAVAGGHAAAFWMCGHQPSPPGPVHIWQRNDGSVSVGGVACDINEQYAPLPGASPAGAHTATGPHREDDPVSAPIVFEKLDGGAWRTGVKTESAGSGSQVIAQQWITYGPIFGDSAWIITALDAVGGVVDRQAGPGDAPGHPVGVPKANNHDYVYDVPPKARTVTLEGTGGTPIAALISKAA